MAGWMNRILRSKHSDSQPRNHAAEPVGPIFEQLEDRRLLSGDVTAVVRGTTLIIKGDGESNQIEIGGAGGTITLDADAADATPTTINGVAGPAMFGGVTNIKIQDKGGYNSYAVDTLTLAGNLDIKLGKETDLLYILDSTIGGRTKLSTSNGADAILIANTNVFTGRLDIKTGRDPDVVQFHTTTNGDGTTTAMDRVMVHLGGGLDRFQFFEETGSTFTDLTIRAGYDVEITGLVATGRLKIDGTPDDDEIMIEASSIDGKVDIKTKGGDDTVTLLTVDLAEPLQINTATDDDTVVLDGLVTLSIVKIALGSKDDTDSFTVATGTDQDTYILAGIIRGDALDSVTIGDMTFVTTPKLIGFDVVDDDM